MAHRSSVSIHGINILVAIIFYFFQDYEDIFTSGEVTDKYFPFFK